MALGLGAAGALFAWAVHHGRRAGFTLRWHPAVGLAVMCACVHALVPLLRGDRVHAAIAIASAGRLLLVMGLAMQVIREPVHLEALGFAVAGGVLGHAGGLAVAGLVAESGVSGYAAVALPVLIGFRLAATRRLVRALNALAIGLGAVAVTGARTALVAGAAAALATALCGRGGDPRRTPVARAAAFGLLAQLVLEVTGTASAAGWTLLAVTAGASLGPRELVLGPSLRWMMMPPLAAWLVLATCYTEARRMVGGYLWSEARAAVARGHVTYAHDLYHEATNARPSDALVLIESARVCIAARHLQAALGAAQRAVELAPANPAALEVLAAVHLARREAPLALPLLRHLAGSADLAALFWAANRFPDLPEAHLARAQALRHLRETAHAERAFRRALELDPRVPGARIQLALMLYGSGRRAEGAALLVEESLIDPRSSELHDALVTCHPPARGQPTRTAARELAEAERARGPRHVSLERALAMDRAQRGDTAGALAALDALVASEPTYADGWAALAHLRGRAGDFLGARVAWERARTLARSAAVR